MNGPRQGRSADSVLAMPEKPWRARWVSRLARWASRRLGSRGALSTPSAVRAAALNSGLMSTVPSLAKLTRPVSDYWGGRCPLTGITDVALLRASHIVAWAECDDAHRLDVHNGLRRRHPKARRGAAQGPGIDHASPRPSGRDHRAASRSYPLDILPRDRSRCKSSASDGSFSRRYDGVHPIARSSPDRVLGRRITNASADPQKPTFRAFSGVPHTSPRMRP